ncbi:MAG TPA: PP2C family protein-serine/threonine phosphatase [Thermoanaerobaculia bacterium]|nr:PP2C family protein-serine/threonine phosphatase [Thermoanaerobaculia bacterium]
MRTYGWRTYGDALRELGLGALAGILILIIEQGAHDITPSFADVARNAVLGAFIFGGARSLETALSWAIEQSRIPTTFRTVVYIVGAWAGYFAGVMTAWMAFGRQDRDLDATGFHFFYALAISALLAILMGLILHHNRKRSDRLLASIARLKEHEFAEKELQIAREMQERLLPPADIEQDGYRVTARTRAAHLVGGDFYDVIRLDDGAVAVLAADVSGKGIAASLLMASCKAAVPFLASSGGAAAVMTALNRTLFDQLQRREFVAMIFCRFEPESGRLQIVNAGMPDPIVISSDRTIHTVAFQGDRLPLGAMRHTRYEATPLSLSPSQRLLLFSDGLPEAVTADGPLGYERADSLIRQCTSVDEILDQLQTSGARIEDDLTLVMLERK